MPQSNAEEVIKDARMLNKIGPQADKVNAVDKWRVSAAGADEDHHGAEIWNAPPVLRT